MCVLNFDRDGDEGMLLVLTSLFAAATDWNLALYITVRLVHCRQSAWDSTHMWPYRRTQYSVWMKMCYSPLTRWLSNHYATDTVLATTLCEMQLPAAELSENLINWNGIFIGCWLICLLNSYWFMHCTTRVRKIVIAYRFGGDFHRSVALCFCCW